MISEKKERVDGSSGSSKSAGEEAKKKKKENLSMKKTHLTSKEVAAFNRRSTADVLFGWWGPSIGDNRSTTMDAAAASPHRMSWLCAEGESHGSACWVNIGYDSY